MEDKKRALPSLGRKWDAKRGRWVVVLKVPKWDRGTVLLSEAPLAVACNYQRPMGLATQTKEDDDDDEGAGVGRKTREAEVVAAEVARVKRWLDAARQKWTPSEILLHEVLLYCREHQPGSAAAKARRLNHSKGKGVVGPAPPPAAPPPETVSTDLDMYMKSAEWLLRNRAYDHFFDEKQTPRENIVRILGNTCLNNDTPFSRREKGVGWYPLIGHLTFADKQSSKEINAAIFFQNTNATLVALTDLKQGDEIVVADTRQPTNTRPPADLGSQDFDGLYRTIFSKEEKKEGVSATWQQLGRCAAEFGKPHIDLLFFAHLKSQRKKEQVDESYCAFLSALKDRILESLKWEWLNVERNNLFGRVPDLMRQEFLLIFVQHLIPHCRAVAPKINVQQDAGEKAANAKGEQNQKGLVAAPPKVEKEAGQKARESKERQGDAKNGSADGAVGEMEMPELEDFLDSMGVTGSARSAPAVKQMEDQLTASEWELYQQLSVLANRRLMVYDVLPMLGNDPSAAAYQQLWQAPALNVPGNIPPAVSLADQWNAIATKLGNRHPSFLDKD